MVDASVWIGALYVPDAMNYRAVRWFTLVRDQPGWLPIVPAHALAEVAGAIARQTGNSDEGLEASGEVSAVPGIQIVPIDASLGAMAASLAAQLKLRGADAIYVAVARRYEAPLVTFDTQLAARSAGVIEVIIP